MKKVFFCLLLFLPVLFAGGNAWAQKSTQPSVLVDEKEIPGEKIIVNNEIYMPVTDLLDVLKVPIQYEANSGTWFINGTEAAVKVIRRNDQDYALVKMLAARARLSYLYDGKTHTLEIRTIQPSTVPAGAPSVPDFAQPAFPPPLTDIEARTPPSIPVQPAASGLEKSPLLSPFNAASPQTGQSAESAQNLSMPLINNFLSSPSEASGQSAPPQSGETMALYDKVEINILVTDLEKQFNAAMEKVPTMNDAPRYVMKFCKDSIARVQGHGTLGRFFPIEQKLIVAAYNTIYSASEIMTQFPLDAKKMEQHQKLWTDGATLLYKTLKDVKNRVGTP
jgi:hypothetical protein